MISAQVRGRQEPGYGLFEVLAHITGKWQFGTGEVPTDRGQPTIAFAAEQVRKMGIERIFKPKAAIGDGIIVEQDFHVVVSVFVNPRNAVVAVIDVSASDDRPGIGRVLPVDEENFVM